MNFLGYVYWNPSKELTPWNIPFLERPILWYGFFFALGFFLAYIVFQALLKDFMHHYRIRRKEISKIGERVSFYFVVGAIVGARLGDVLFYQSPLSYQDNLLGIFKFWEGGLSSHGGVIGILISLWIFCVRHQKKYPMLTWVALIDLLSIPSLLGGGFIRIGNFFNQEIIGKATTVPWGVIFGNPVDGIMGPRHPAQLYESLFYFVFAGILWYLRKTIPKMYRLGKTSGLFFIVTFSFRFIVEFFKSPQSALIHEGFLFDMGQILSVPMILVGLILFFRHQSGLRARTVKGN